MWKEKQGGNIGGVRRIGRKGEKGRENEEKWEAKQCKWGSEWRRREREIWSGMGKEEEDEKGRNRNEEEVLVWRSRKGNADRNQKESEGGEMCLDKEEGRNKSGYRKGKDGYGGEERKGRGRLYLGERGMQKEG